jgi:hypothetical protein
MERIEGIFTDLEPFRKPRLSQKMMHFMVPAKPGQMLTKDFFDGCPVGARCW